MKRAFATALCVLTIAARANAGGPDVWDVARDPKVASDEKVYTAAQALVLQSKLMGERSSILSRDFADTARSMLDEIHAGTHRDPKYRFLLGEALERLRDDSRVIAVLEPAVEMAPDDPDVGDALWDLAVAYARAQRPKDEMRTYDRFLEVVWSEVHRASALSNRAESEARLNELARSIASYRASIEMSPDSPAPRWGLAVVLDRAGDFGRAIEEGKAADSVDFGPVSILDQREVTFFVPDYEIHWYHAIRQVSKAAAAKRAIDRMTHWEAASVDYARFAAAASMTDRWRALALSRSKLCASRAAGLKSEVLAEQRTDHAGVRPDLVMDR